MRGKPLMERKRRYRMNKAKERRNSKRRYKRLKNRPSFKKQQRIRRKNPKAFRKRRGSVLTAPEIAFVMGERMDLGYVRNISPATGLVTYHRRFGNDFELESLPVADFMASVVFLSDHDIDSMFELIDVELGPEAHMADPSLSVEAVRNSAGLEGIDCDSGTFKKQCEKLVGKRELTDMSPSELAQVDATLIQQFTYDEGEEPEFPHDDDDEPRQGEQWLLDPSDFAHIYGRVVIPPQEMVEKVAAKWAEMLYEKPKHPGNTPDNWHDRGQGWTKKKKRQQEREVPPQNSYPYGFVDNNPGSAKVIPEGHDFANKSERVMKQSALNWGRLDPEKRKSLFQLVRSPLWKQFVVGRVKDIEIVSWLQEHGWPQMNERGFDALKQHVHDVRSAALISDIEGKTGTDVHDRAAGLSSKLKKVDRRNGMLTFAVQGSSGDHTVKLKAVRQGNLRDINKLDVYVACSCPFWQWQGPEYHAKQGGYLFGQPRGTASKPEVKDPGNQHGACKHVLAVLTRVKDIGTVRKDWGRKKGSAEEPLVRFLADTLARGETRILSAQRVAARYVGGDAESVEE
jgi:hypothetical protein